MHWCLWWSDDAALLAHFLPRVHHVTHAELEAVDSALSDLQIAFPQKLTAEEFACKLVGQWVGYLLCKQRLWVAWTFRLNPVPHAPLLFQRRLASPMAQEVPWCPQTRIRKRGIIPRNAWRQSERQTYDVAATTARNQILQQSSSAGRAPTTLKTYVNRVNPKYYWGTQWTCRSDQSESSRERRKFRTNRTFVNWHVDRGWSILKLSIGIEPSSAGKYGLRSEPSQDSLGYLPWSLACYRLFSESSNRLGLIELKKAET